MIEILGYHLIEESLVHQDLSTQLRKHRIDENLLRKLDDEARMILYCACESKIKSLLANIPRTDIAIVLGTDFGTLPNYENFYDSILKKDLLPQAFSGAIPSFNASVLSLNFAIKGSCFTMVDNNNYLLKALLRAFLLLKNNQYQYILTGGYTNISKTKQLLINNNISRHKNLFGIFMTLLKKTDQPGNNIIIKEIFKIDDFNNDITSKMICDTKPENIYLLQIDIDVQKKIYQLKSSQQNLVVLDNQWNPHEKSLFKAIPHIFTNLNNTDILFISIDNSYYGIILSKNRIDS